MTNSTGIPNAVWVMIARGLVTVLLLLLSAFVGVVWFAAQDALSENRERIAEIQALREERVKRVELDAIIAKLNERDDRIQAYGNETRGAFDVFRGETVAKMDFMIGLLDKIEKAVTHEGRTR